MQNKWKGYAMTKGEVYKQVYDLSVHGKFNHQKWSFLKFKDYCNE